MALVVDDQSLPGEQFEHLGKPLNHHADDFGLEGPVGDALVPPSAAGADGRERLTLQDLHGRDVATALDLRHGLRLGHVGVVVKSEDHRAGADSPVEFRDVAKELLVDVVLPGDEILGVAAHQPDLAVAEDRFGLEGHVLGEGLGGFLLEAGDPRGVDGHLGWLVG